MGKEGNLKLSQTADAHHKTVMVLGIPVASSAEALRAAPPLQLRLDLYFLPSMDSDFAAWH